MGIITLLARRVASVVCKDKKTLVECNKECVAHKQQDGSYGMAQKYQSTFAQVEKYLSAISKPDLKVEEVDNEFIECFAEFLKSEDLAENTIHFYLRNLSAMYHLQNKDYTDNPFSHVNMRACPTRKRALDKQTMQLIKDFDSKGKASFDLARDLFMFSFYTQGMPFVDIAYLKASDIENGTIRYKRHKTNQPVTVTLVPEAKEIIRRYCNINKGICGKDNKDKAKDNKTKGKKKNKENTNTKGEAKAKDYYIFGIINNRADSTTAYRQYRSGLATQNRRLKKIGKMLGLDLPLTTYIARHTWATLAQNNGVPTAVISRSLGHTSETTTRIYLGSMDTKILAKYNRLTTRL
jgi:integrase